jgi:hypothetical protein
VDFCSDDRIALVPLGGGSLKQWVAKRYLRGLGLPEVHIYDRDDETPPKYQPEHDAVNARGDRSWAVITAKRELENYLHAEAISEGLGVTITFTDTCDVPLLVAQAVHTAAGSGKPWGDVLTNPKDIAEKVSRAKKRLNKEAVARMTAQRLAEVDSGGELLGWLRRINAMLA